MNPKNSCGLLGFSTQQPNDTTPATMIWEVAINLATYVVMILIQDRGTPLAYEENGLHFIFAPTTSFSKNIVT